MDSELGSHLQEDKASGQSNLYTILVWWAGA